MKSINLKRVIDSDFENAILRVTEALKLEGFGVLTRIDFHSKMKEKLNQDMAPLVILGACNPLLAYEAYLRNSDVTGLLPCNAVVRDLGAGKVSVELTKPSAMMEILGDQSLVDMAKSADEKLDRALQKV